MRGWDALVSGKQPSTVGELLDQLEPVLDNAEAKQAFLGVIEAEIAVREGNVKLGGADTDLAALRALRDGLKGVSSPGIENPDFVPLEGTSLVEEPVQEPSSTDDDPASGPHSTGGGVAAPRTIEDIAKAAHESPEGRDRLLDHFGSWEETIARLQDGRGEASGIEASDRQALIGKLVKHRDDLKTELNGLFETERCGAPRASRAATST